MEFIVLALSLYTATFLGAFFYKKLGFPGVSIVGAIDLLWVTALAIIWQVKLDQTFQIILLMAAIGMLFSSMTMMSRDRTRKI